MNPNGKFNWKIKAKKPVLNPNIVGSINVKNVLEKIVKVTDYQLIFKTLTKLYKKRSNKKNKNNKKIRDFRNKVQNNSLKEG